MENNNIETMVETTATVVEECAGSGKGSNGLIVGAIVGAVGLAAAGYYKFKTIKEDKPKKQKVKKKLMWVEVPEEETVEEEPIKEEKNNKK